MKPSAYLAGALWIALFWTAAAALGGEAPRVSRTEEGAWELALEEDFSKPSALDNWKLDGAAQVSVTKDGKLLIATQRKEIEGKGCRASVLWLKKPVEGDIRIEFDAKADPKSRCILFYNARPAEGHKTIFDWARPQAKYSDYATDERIQLYTFSILRSDQKKLNVRRLGGRDSIETQKKRYATNRKENKKEWVRLWRLFQKQTVLLDVDSPFGDASKFYHVDVRVVGPRLTGYVDGKKVFDFVDRARVKNPLSGGYIGLRNFRPTKAWYDNLRVYRLKKK